MHENVEDATLPGHPEPSDNHRPIAPIEAESIRLVAFATIVG